MVATSTRVRFSARPGSPGGIKVTYITMHFRN
jgi:hypothetical protein